MAEGNREDDSNPFSYHNFSRKDRNDSEDSDGTEDSYVRPDLGIGNEPSFEKKTEGTNEQPKREENPFSFKHFLCSETNSYQSTGARPKVYGESYSHMNTPDSEHSSVSRTPRRINTPELTSVLPDFVQDHLVIEQCYNLNHSDTPPNLDNLPDFALNSSDRSRLWEEPRNSLSGVSSSDTCLSDHQSSVLDVVTQSSSVLPFDLPLVGEINDLASSPCEVGVSKSLPDFLSDGPIHSSLQPSVQSPGCDVSSGEVERLKRELDAMRRQLTDKTTRIQMLEKELHTIRIRDQEEFGILEKAIEQVEDNLKRSTRRAVTAENNVSKLKQENKSLTNELSTLRLEQRYSEGGASSSVSTPLESQRLAQDLRQAATSAEQSLRTLMSGVGNLRSIAASLEAMCRCQEQSEDPDDETGPAL